MIKSFYQFITEATLNDSKIGVGYELSRPGRKNLSKKLNISEENLRVNFNFSNETPNDDDEILVIGKTTFFTNTFKQFKDKNNKEREDLFVYELTIDDIGYKWAVAPKGIETTVIRQHTRTGASKRGNYFKETSFIITLAKMLYDEKGIKIDIFSNRGQIFMDYSGDEAKMSEENSEEFINEYEVFISSNEKITEVMYKHCEVLIDWLEENGSLNKLTKVVKNHKELTINKIAKNLVDDFVELSNKVELNIPPITNLAKWNPSDFWMIFDDYKNEDIIKIEKLDDLNTYLYNCIKDGDGIVGVSLKQSVKTDIKKPYEVSKDKKGDIITTYKDFDISNNKKTAEIEFEWEVDREGKNPKGEGEIDSRTFDTKSDSKVQLEIKGKKGAGYVSGKAGALIDFLLKKYKRKDLDLVNLRSEIQKAKTKPEIRDIINKYNYKLSGDDESVKKLKEVWEKDLEGDGDKNSAENSRLQSIIFIDWLIQRNEIVTIEYPDPNKPKRTVTLKDKIIDDIVKFGRSESDWSAPHLLLK